MSISYYKKSEIWASSTSLSLLPPTNKDKQIDAKILLKSDMVFERLRIDRRSTELSSVQSCSNSKKHWLTKFYAFLSKIQLGMRLQFNRVSWFLNFQLERN